MVASRIKDRVRLVIYLERGEYEELRERAGQFSVSAYARALLVGEIPGATESSAGDERSTTATPGVAEIRPGAVVSRSRRGMPAEAARKPLWKKPGRFL